MKKVLLIGDSIMGGYASKVKNNLKNKYDVYWVDDNCRFSAYTLNSLRFWLGMQYMDTVKCALENPDIIHWNNGLWDTARLFGENRCFTDFDTYVDNMTRIYEFLRSNTNAKIILANTTPTRKEKEQDCSVGHFVSDIIKYNHGLEVALRDKVDGFNDLFGLVYPQINKVIKKDDLIHLTEYGENICADYVANSIINVDK